VTMILMTIVAFVMYMSPNTLGAINTSDEAVLTALPGPLAVLSLYAVVDSVSVVIQVSQSRQHGSHSCCERGASARRHIGVCVRVRACVCFPLCDSI
jgi:hypothetical protein